MSRVAVVIVVFNNESYIREALESVFGQTRPADEIIVYDDGSTDATAEILRSYTSHTSHSNLQCHFGAGNLGEAAARSRAMSMASADLIALCDGDDLLLPRSLERYSEVLDGDNSLGLVYADYFVIDLDTQGRCSKLWLKKGKEPYAYWDLATNAVMGSGAMLRKRDYDKAGGYRDDSGFLPHNDLWFRMAEVASLKYLDDEAYYVYRRHPGSLTSSPEYRRLRDAQYRELLERTIARRYPQTGGNRKGTR